MLSVMGSHAPIAMDFSHPSEHAVLDLRKVKAKDEHHYITHQSDHEAASPTSFQPISPIPCYPSSTYFNHHMESSEDSSDRGSLSPPSSLSTSFPTIMAPGLIAPVVNRSGKPTRPFKAYPKDPLTLPALSTAEAILGHASNEAYAEFRRRLLPQLQSVSNSATYAKMKRPVSPKKVPGDDQKPSSSCTESSGKDAAYWERRRKNNEAAKRSRDARRAKEDEIAIRAAFLEQENIQLKYENASLRNEAAKLRCLLYNR
ncbi:hypothetical protein LSTR_LSTR015031 [Laodelphax striatellus]|uniref:BZIP domain-containing protein n=1 Tax=Laodelphax striatellus TaxID=195883 RepID=A0A482XSS3_LAOST|nr:hypothetical protein LSTR_LSTR015031 [Laodelphax striatellus]